MKDDPNQNPEAAEDEAITQILGVVEDDAPSADSAALSRIFANAGDQFEQQSVQPALTPNGRSPKMIIKLAVAVSSLAACLLLAWVGGPEPAQGEPTLGAVLERVGQAKTLHMTVTKNDREANIWVRLPGDVRWEDSPANYRIAAGGDLWEIDEPNNRVTSQPSPWWREDARRLDLLTLLGLSREQTTLLSRSKPEKTIRHGGKDCFLFRAPTRFEDQSFVVQAIAEIDGGELHSIAVWRGKEPKGPPVSELRLIARDVPVDEDKFVVSDSLREDGRIGKLIESQGIVMLRPMSSDRWTPVASDMLLKPGDWIRSDVRGANAASLTLTSGFRVTLGPGSLIEVQSPRRVRLHQGEAKIAGNRSQHGSLQLIGTKDELIAMSQSESVHYRLDRDAKLTPVKGTPKWLAGFEGTSSEESLGSLVCNVDGRSVPLTVGSHHVTVEIRDQIARTTIEETFVNHTHRNLEGTFHFPLPQDASISGFGMWIAGELVEADVVEKQRAREIYETILRERRDPGLLEWSGGNIFKARVFPIPAHAEKRIRIVYTQVLPMRGSHYRYSYGLRSEMLRKTPLRDLSLNVLVHSSLPLRSVRSSTHQVRSQSTTNSAKLEFAAQDYTPDRDFEVVCEVDSTQADVNVVPHRRGDDGYFLVQLTPPGAKGNWQRELIPGGKPLHLLVVCDTSSSMDAEKRKQQTECVQALLSSLGPKDRYNLAVVDVDCLWHNEESVEPTSDLRAESLSWLSQRDSLGWTDLDRMAESAGKRIEKGTHVVYVGDGMATARDADPQSYINRLKRLSGGLRQGTFHAISVGSSYEASVLQAIASIGGGSVRKISGEQTPVKVAFELMNELAQPGIRDLKVEFNGLKVAAVYPNKLPNLAAGNQQILIGRYLPQGKDQSGEIVVTGTRDGESVRFVARIDLADAEKGNSFIPRLWARAHLQHLLQQGRSDLIKNEVIALSEAFHIITPYTSLLVLETDEDRERFGVQRRYQLRDGERFFADGKDAATFDLLREQMKRAGDWRIGVRRRVLMELSELGRDTATLSQLRTGQRQYPTYAISGGAVASGVLSVSGRLVGGVGGGWSGGWSGAGFDSNGDRTVDFEGKAKSQMAGLDDLDEIFDRSSKSKFSKSGELDMQWNSLSQSARMPASKASAFDQLLRKGRGSRPGAMRLSSAREQLSALQPYAFDVSRLGDDTPYTAWLDTLFPPVPEPPAKSRDDAPAGWPQEAIELADRLHQSITLPVGGLEIRRDTVHLDPHWNRVRSEITNLDLYSSLRWLKIRSQPGSDTRIEWCDERRRGIQSRGFALGRERESRRQDLRSFLPGQRAYAHAALYTQYPDHRVEMDDDDTESTTTLTLLSPNANPPRQVRVVIDTDRHLVLKTEQVTEGVVTSATRYTDHVEIAGVWWPRGIESVDKEGDVTSRVKQSVRSLNDARFAKRVAAEMPDRERAQILAMPLPSRRESQIAANGGAATYEHRVTLLLDACRIQNWDEALRQAAEIDRLADGKRGTAWLQISIRIASRRNEEARQLLTERAKLILADKSDLDLFRARYLLDQLASLADANERLQQLEGLRRVFERQSDQAGSLRIWTVRRNALLRTLDRPDEFLPAQRELATSGPWDANAQATYAHDLRDSGDIDSALKWFDAALERAKRSDVVSNQLRNAYATLLKEEGLIDALVSFTDQWRQTNPIAQQVFARYLYALNLADRVDEADALASAWLDEARQQEKLDAVALEKLSAATSYAMGSRYQIQLSWIEPKWLEPLLETAVFFLDHKDHFSSATSIIDNYYFGRSDRSDQIRALCAKRLAKSCETLEPAKLKAFVRWTVHGSDITDDAFDAIARTIRARWEMAEERAIRRSLGDALLLIYSSRMADSEYLPFMRDRVARAEQEQDLTLADSYADSLFDVLLTVDWTAENETEAIALLQRERSPGKDVTLVRVEALHRLVDAMLKQRVKVDMKSLQADGHPEKLTRTELAKRTTQFRRLAREGVSASLSALEQRLEESDWRTWVTIERDFVDLRLGRRHARIAEHCWKLLGDLPTAANENAANENVTKEDDEPGNGDQDDPDPTSLARSRLLHTMQQERVLRTLQFLAVRRSASKPLVERLVAYLTAGTRLKGDAAIGWKEDLFTLLIALDRPDPLRASLEDWIRNDELPANWQRSLGYLLAEKGDVGPAIKLFETVRRETRLEPAESRVLADWYLVTSRRADYEVARTDVFLSMQEQQIANWLQQSREPWYRTDVPLPTKLDDDVLFAFRALFEKSNQPGTYASTLREFYAACRDFRLLQMIPDALLGRTPQQVYPFLRSLRRNVLSEIRKEATADELVGRLEVLRDRSESPIDRRALDLLEVMIRQQASQVLDQPGPHVQAAIAALDRAMVEPWADGEVRQMAELLADLGKTRHVSFASQRRRRLRELLSLTEAGTDDRLFVSWYIARNEHRSMDDHAEALSIMENAMAEFETDAREPWAAHMNPPLFGYVELLESAGRFADAEQVLTEYVDRSVAIKQKRALERRRGQVRVNALARGGRVALGEGDELFADLESSLVELAKEGADNHRTETVSLLIRLYKEAKSKDLEGYQDRVRRFGRERLPSILKRPCAQHSQIITQVGRAIKEILGTADALEFLIGAFERYPGQYEYTWQSSWQRHGYTLAQWHSEMNGKVKELEPRLLKIVLTELRRDLESQHAQSRYFYHDNYGPRFWKEKAGDFSRVAEEVLKDNLDSGRSITYIADYLYGGLDRTGRAIEIMSTAHRQGLLNTKQQIQLCDYLHSQRRHVESVPILEPIVEQHPDVMSYRTRLITGYGKSGRRGEMRDLLKASDAHFRQQGRWVESDVAILAQCCLGNGVLVEAAGYFAEAISMHQRGRNDRGVGNGVLSNYYSDQSRAYAGLGKTIEAVEAASAAIVAWGPRFTQRQSSVYWLKRALSDSKDLDGYVRHLDKEVARTGQDSPLVRQQIGLVYVEQKKYDDAIEQLRASIEMQPNDSKSHEALIECFRAKDDTAAIARQIMAQIDFDRHNLELYKQLAKELANDKNLVERAVTTIVEAAPNEASHHRAIAEIRQEQDRWGDAIRHWQRVASLREMEPDGLLKLAEAYIHVQDWSAARDTIGKLNQTEWPSRFSNTGRQTEALQRRLP